MTRLIFRDYITGSSSSGKQFIRHGENEICLDVIPPDHPTDWPMGPKMKAGMVGAYFVHGFFPEKHGPTCFAVGSTEQAAFDQACAYFAGKFCEWPKAQKHRKVA